VLAADVALAQKNNKAALDYAEKAIGLDRSYSYGYIYRAEARHELKQSKEAIADLDKALELNPSLKWVYMLRANYFSDADDYKAAAADYERLIKLEPLAAPAYEGLGEARMGLRDYHGALAAFNSAIEHDADNTDALANRAIAEAELGELKQAKTDFEKYCAAKPDNFRMRFNLATVSYELGEMKDSANSYEKVLGSAATDYKNGAYAGILCSFAYRHMGNDASARDALTRSKKFTFSPWAIKCADYLLGLVSSDALEQAASNNGERTEAKTYIGINSLLKGDSDTADRCFAWVLRNGEKDFYEYRLAQLESKNLTAAKSAHAKSETPSR
jgi:tetratricopeptide (TPR) repeat protein